MTPHDACLMADYNLWMNQRMYLAAHRLTDEALHQERGAFFGSLFGTLNHLAAGDTLWLHRFAQHAEAGELRADLQPFPLPASLRTAVATSLAPLQQYRLQLDEVIVRWSRSLTNEQLATTLHYRNTAGESHRKNLGELALHFFNHQTHHRGQASTLLHQAGVDVGVTDLLALVAESP